MMRYFSVLIVFGLLCFSFLDQAEARQIGRYMHLSLHINDDYQCGDIARLTVKAPDERFFHGDLMDVRRLVDPQRAKLVSQCQQLQQIEVIGRVGGKQVYHGRAMASKKWVLFKVPVQRAGKKGIFINKDDELIFYQDKNLTIKGPPVTYASNWCGSGTRLRRGTPINLRAYYTVDHFERHALFAPGYADFVQQNLIPLVKEYCGSGPANIQLMMMDRHDKNRFFDILLFSVEDGKAVGKAYSAPAPPKTGSGDQKKFEAFVRKMCIAQNVAVDSFLVKRKGPDVPTKRGALRYYKEMSSHTDLYWQCGKAMNLYIQTSDASYYKGGRKALQVMVDAERMAQQKKCRAVETFVINGALDGKWYFRGSSAKADNWAIKGQIIGRDDKYYQPHMFPQDAEAKYKLGLMYFEGERLVANSVQGAMTIKDAAEWGYADAQFLLGILYEKGLGVQKHQHYAQKWLKKAADKGHQKARDHLRQRAANAKLAEQRRIEAEKAARRKGIVYKSARFWQEFADFDTPRMVFEGDFSGLTSSINFKNFYIDFVAYYYRYCKSHLPPLKECDRRGYVTIEVQRDSAGFETSRREVGRTEIYIDPRFTDAFDQYQKDVAPYNQLDAAGAIVRMVLNFEKQGIADSMSDVMYELKFFEMNKFFNKVPCGSATMIQMRENLLRAATADRSLQASAIVLANAAAESDSVEVSVRTKTFEQACHEYHNERNPGNYDRWCSCLYREARKVMTPAELTHFADDFDSYYRDIDNKQEGPNDPRWRLQGPLNKCRR